MAVRSLGSLTLDLVAKIGGFSRGMNEAERAADKSARDIARKQKAAAKQVEKAWSDTKKWITGALAGLSVAGLMTSFIRETVAAQNEQAQLAAVLKSTGEAAGYSAQQLNKMSAELSGKSIFSEGEITNAQTRLLSYTGIVGEQFPEAMQSVIDMASRMGMSVEQSAETIGRALDIPSAGLTALSRQGFRFTEEQKKLIKSLEDTGRVAEAQGILLDALKSSYGGAAEAARNTLGGAIQALKNQFGSLMTGEGGSVQGATDAINDLTKVLQSNEVKEAFDALTSLIAGTISLLVRGASAFLEFGKAIGTGLAIRIHGPDDPLERIAADIVKVQEEITSLDNLLNKPRKGGLPLSAEEIANLNDRLIFARKNLQDLQKARDSMNFAPSTSTGGTTGPRRPPGPIGLTEEQKRAAEQAAKAARAYLENLQKQLRATENLSVAETVLRDIQEGRLKLAGGITQQEVLGIAKQIDAARELARVTEDVRKTREATASMQAQIDDQALASVQVLIDSNQALRDEIELMGLEGDALNAVEQARLASTIALKEEALAMAQNAEESATVIESLEREINLLKQRGELLNQRTTRAKEIKELEELQKFNERAMQNIQDTIGSGLADIMDGNFKNIADGFTRMINRMVAEAAAAQLMKHLFGDMVKGGEGSGAIGNIFKSIARSLFGGGRAAGGQVSPGRLYEVNENGPEVLAMNGRQYLMMGNESGRVVPNSKLGGKTTNIAVNVTAQQNVSRESALQQGKRIGEGIQLALARNG